MNSTISLFLNAAKNGNTKLLFELSPYINNTKIYNKALELAIKNKHKETAKVLYNSFDASSIDIIEKMINEGNYKIEKYLKYCDQECIDEILIVSSKEGLANIIITVIEKASERAKRIAFIKAVKLNQLSSLTILLSYIKNKKILVDGLIVAIDKDELTIAKYLIYTDKTLIDDAYYYSALKGTLDIFMYLYYTFPKSKEFYNEIYEYADQDVKIFLSGKIL